jgi:hypothetical protein
MISSIKAVPVLVDWTADASRVFTKANNAA